MIDEATKLAYALGWAILVVAIVAVPTGPPLVNLLAGFFPLLLTVVIGLTMNQLKKPIPIQGALAIPVVLSVLLGLLGALGPTLVFGQLEVWYLAVVNVIAGLGVMVILTGLVPDPYTRTPSHINKHIEDAVRYVYAINEAVERVLHHGTGATSAMRRHVRLSQEKVDQLEKLFHKRRYQEAHTIVYELYEQLRMLFETEHDLFGHHLKDLKRDPHGRSRLIDILIDNDWEPVRQWVEGLTHTLQALNRELIGVRT